MPPIHDGSSFAPAIAASIQAGVEALDETRERLARVLLLFGFDSPSGAASRTTLTQLSSALEALRTPPSSVRDADMKKSHERSYDTAYKALQEFSEEALREMRFGWARELRAAMRGRNSHAS
jgi:hypothetical protein